MRVFVAAVRTTTARRGVGKHTAGLFARLVTTSEAKGRTLHNPEESLVIQPVKIERLDMASGCGVAHVPDLSGRDYPVGTKRRVDVPNAFPLDTVALRPMASLCSPHEEHARGDGRPRYSAAVLGKLFHWHEN